MKQSALLAGILLTLLFSALLGPAALAAPNVANTTQKGSLLIFPKIDVTEGRTTIIRITNDQNRPIDVKCYYSDLQKNRVDFQFEMTKNQPVWFDAHSGQGSVGVNIFHRVGSRLGQLKCWAINPEGTHQLKWNHLSGTATIYDFENDTAWEYTAWAFYARGVGNNEQVGSRPGRLDLNGQAAGGAYDQCPQYLIGHFTPAEAIIGTADGGIRVLGNRLSVASCTQDMSQDFDLYVTKLNFDIWNQHEVKFTGAHQCIDSWYETLLDQVGENPFNFTQQVLTGHSAYFRLESQQSALCDDYDFLAEDGYPVPNRPRINTAVGLVGVMATDVDMDSGNGPEVDAVHGTNLNGAGRRAGRIFWDDPSICFWGEVAEKQTEAASDLVGIQCTLERY